MIKITGSVPLKTRLPLAAWVIAGTRDSLSMASSVVHAPASIKPTRYRLRQRCRVTEQVLVGRTHLWESRAADRAAHPSLQEGFINS